MSPPDARINVDDVGLCSQAAISLFPLIKAGLVNSISVLIVGQGVSGVEQLLRESEIEHIGLHACWVDQERALSGPSAITDDAGLFLNRTTIMKRSILYRRSVRVALKRELDLQVEACLDRGIRITHLDSHQHMHVFPPFFDVFAETAQRLGGVAIRQPLCTKALERPVGLILNLLSTVFKRRASIRDMETYPSLGFEYGGRLSEAKLRSLVARVTRPGTEIMTHAGILDERCRQKYARWGYDWQGEYEALRAFKS